MRVPTRTAERGLGPALGEYRAGRWPSASSEVRPMATISCLSSCVGSGAALRCGPCGADLDCWRHCAGITDTGCVAACLRT